MKSNENQRPDGLSHIDQNDLPTMVDVSSKDISKRTAIAESSVELPPEVSKLFRDGEIHGPKGPVFQTAIIAGTQAAKKTWELIPFCHPLNLESIKIEIGMKTKSTVFIESRVSLSGKTGVEMEALTACSVAALTIYDMCKALSHNIVINQTRLIQKRGGKSDLNL